MNYNHLLLCVALAVRNLSQQGCWFEIVHLHNVSVWYTLYYYQLAKLSAKQSLLQIVVVYKNSKSTESKLVPEKPKNQIEYKSPAAWAQEKHLKAYIYIYIYLGQSCQLTHSVVLSKAFKNSLLEQIQQNYFLGRVAFPISLSYEVSQDEF